VRPHSGFVVLRQLADRSLLLPGRQASALATETGDSLLVWGNGDSQNMAPEFPCAVRNIPQPSTQCFECSARGKKILPLEQNYSGSGRRKGALENRSLTGGESRVSNMSYSCSLIKVRGKILVDMKETSKENLEELTRRLGERL